MPRFLTASLTALGIVAAACADAHSPAVDEDAEVSGPELSVVTFGITRVGADNESNRAAAINDLGQVAGTATIGTELIAQAFLWTNGTKQWLPGESGTESVAADVNAFGVVAGLVTEPGAAAIWNNGPVVRLSSPFTEGGPSTTAINDAGRILGSHRQTNGVFAGLVWTDALDASPTVLATAAGLSALPRDISNAGVIVGRTELPEGKEPFFGSAVIWPDEHAQPQTLKNFSGGLCEGKFAAAIALNELGAMVGQCHVDEFESHAAYWARSDAIPFDLGDVSVVGINELGQILGTACDPDCHLVLWGWEAGAFRRFDLGIPDEASNLVTAVDLNNTGQALGGRFAGAADNTSFIWTIPMHVTVDAIPGSSTNAVKLDGRGTLAVAMLGSRWFRAADLDPASLTLGNDDGM